VGDISEKCVRKCSPPSLDAAIAELAGRQHGVVSLEQLRSLSLDARAVQQRASRGKLHRVHRGVYSVGHRLLSQDGAWMAAVLACGRGAVLSHRSAAAAWGLRPTSRARIEVTIERSRRGPARVEAHRVRALAADDVTTLRAIPITTVARTLVDLAAVLPAHALERAVHEAEVLRLLDTTTVHQAMTRAPGRRGLARLGHLLSVPSPGPTRSAFEDRFRTLCRDGELPTPRMNTHVRAGNDLIEVDALWPDTRLIVELDGAAAHHTARAFHDDRRRDAALAAHGYQVIRLTWQRVTEEPEAVRDELRRIHALRARDCAA
jgi:very-short-patch-repair endonuclease